MRTWAGRPEGVDLLIRAAQDRKLADGGSLLATAEALAEAGRMMIDLPAAPGRKARTAILCLRFGEVEIAAPVSRQRRAELAALPPTVRMNLVDAREIDPPQGVPAAHWRLLTSLPVANLDDAQRMITFYRQRWTIEQLFRTLKTKGFDIEALRIAETEPFEKLVAAATVAAVTVLQMTRERDGTANRPLEDAFDPDTRLEGKTDKQKNPHPKGSLAFATWVCARLGGWNCYYGKPGPITVYNGFVRWDAIKTGFALRDV